MTDPIDRIAEDRDRWKERTERAEAVVAAARHAQSWYYSRTACSHLDYTLKKYDEGVTSS